MIDRPGTKVLWLLLAIVVGIAFPLSSSAAESTISDSTAKYFRELRRRGLYRLCESSCLERLSRSGVSSTRRADLTLELARSLAEHATVVAEPEQTELWNRSRLTLTDFLKQEPKNPRRLLLEAQAAFLPAIVGNFRRRQAELKPFDEEAIQRATASLNEAIDALRTLEGELADHLRKSSASRPTSDGELRNFEVRALVSQVRYRLGNAQLDLAYLHPAESPDRSALLLDAQKMLKSVPEAGDDSELIWMSRLAYLECSRMLGDAARTLRDLDFLEKQEPPPDVAERLRAERIRVLIAQKHFSEAAELLDDAKHDRGILSGEMRLLSIQLLLAEWDAGKSAPNAPLPPKLQKVLDDRAARLRKNGGGYWSDRAALLIQEARDVEHYGPELAQLAGKAQAAFNGGHADEAIGLYGEAAAKAHRDGRAELAFHFGFTRASIEIKSRSWADAAADLLELSEQFPKNPKTPEAHLLAAFALGKSYDEKPTPGRREEYTRVLDEHRTRYGGGPTGPEAVWMLAKLNERRGKITAALDLYKLIPRDHKRGPAARVAVVRSFEQILDRLRQLGEPVDVWEQDAIKTLQQMLPRSSPRTSVPEPELLADAEVAIRLARILLRARPPQFEAADRLPRAGRGACFRPPICVPSDTGAAETKTLRIELRSLISQLQVVSLAGQGRFQDAREMLQQLSAASPAEMLRILDGIAPLQSDDRQDPLHDLGKLQLEAAQRLDESRSQLAATEQRRLDECLAQAYLATGETKRGIAVYEKLLAQAPRDMPLLQAYAELLMKCGNPDCLKRALPAWQKLEALQQPATPEWFTMRYEVCRTLVLQDEAIEAGKLLKVTRLLYPKIEDEKLEAKFAELEALCEKGKSTTPKAKIAAEMKTDERVAAQAPGWGCTKVDSLFIPEKISPQD